MVIPSPAARSVVMASLFEAVTSARATWANTLLKPSLMPGRGGELEDHGCVGRSPAVLARAFEGGGEDRAKSRGRAMRGHRLAGGFRRPSLSTSSPAGRLLFVGEFGLPPGKWK